MKHLTIQVGDQELKNISEVEAIHMALMVLRQWSATDYIGIGNSTKEWFVSVRPEKS